MFNKAQLTRSIFNLSVIGGVSRILGFISVMILSRFMDQAQYGQYVYYVTLINIGSLLLNFNVYQSLVKEFNDSKYGKNEKYTLINACLLLEFLCGVIAAIAIIVIFYMSEGLANYINEYTLLILFIGLGVFSQYLIRGLMAGFQSMNRMTFYGVSDALPQFVFFMFICLVFNGVILIQLDDKSAFTAKVASYAITLTCMFYFFNRIINKIDIPHSNLIKYLKFISRESVFPLITGWLSIVFYQADRLMLKWLREDSAELGIFHNAMLLGIVITFFTAIYSKTIYPNIARIYDESGVDRLGNIVNEYNDFVIQVILPFAALLHLMAQPIVEIIYGEAFKDSGEIFAIWILVVVYVVSQGPSLQILFVTKQRRYLAVALSIGSLVNIILNLLLIPEYGPLGAVYATGAGALTNAAIVRLKVSKIMDISSSKCIRNQVTLLAMVMIIVANFSADLKIVCVFAVVIFLISGVKTNYNRIYNQ